jgi:Peptidase inhibitor I78 family
MIRASLIAIALLAAACTPPAADTPADEPITPVTAAPTTREEATAQDTCGASQYRALVGSNFAAVTLPADSGIRIIQPDTMVTEDFRVGRINIIAGADGIITSVECF